VDCRWDTSTEYANIQEALSAYGMDRPVVPRCLPDGFVPENLAVDDQTCAGSSAVFVAAYISTGSPDRIPYGYADAKETGILRSMLHS